jgi:hypothetical protein
LRECDSRWHNIMKKLALTLMGCVTAIGVFAQGSIQFQNFVGGQLRSPVYDVDPASPLEQKTGNTAAGIPAGTQTYGGALLQGTNYTAELWGGPLGSTEAALQFVDTTVFRTNLAAGLVVAKTVIVQGVLPGQRGTFQVRAWDNKGRTITNWSSALAAWNAGEIALGKSALFSPVEPLGGGIAGGIILPPIGLFGLTSFDLRMVPPTIVTQPHSQTVECGDDVSFSVVATSPHPLTYRWYFNQTNLLTEGPSSITVSNADFNDAGSYHSVVETSLGSVASDSAILTVADTTRPTLAVCPPARVLPADMACTATLPDLTGEIVAADTCSSVTLSQVPPAGTPLIAGIHPILLTVTDSSGNATNCTTLITVADANPPAIVACATNQAISATSGCDALLPDLRGQVMATDNCGVVTTSQAPPPGTVLAPGATLVTLTVADAAGNTANCNAVMTVIDSTPPGIVVCPSDRTLSADTNCQAILPDLTGELTAADNCGSVTITQAPPPGTVLPLGATAVTFTVSDTAGNSTNCAAQVAVRDTTPPAIVG